MNTVPIYEHDGNPYVRMSDLPEEESARMEAWLEGLARPVIPALEYQDAVYIWQYFLWDRLNDPEAKAAMEAALDEIDITEYTPDEIEDAIQMALFDVNHTPWELYL